MGELAFAAHSRRAEAEMRALAHDVLVRLADGEASEDPPKAAYTRGT
jgi:hypothetical protein